MQKSASKLDWYNALAGRLALLLTAIAFITLLGAPNREPSRQIRGTELPDGKLSIVKLGKGSRPVLTLKKNTVIPKSFAASSLALVVSRPRPRRVGVLVKTYGKSFLLADKSKVTFPIPFLENGSNRTTVYRVSLKQLSQKKRKRATGRTLASFTISVPRRPQSIRLPISSSSTSSSTSSASSSSSQSTSSSSQSSQSSSTNSSSSSTSSTAPCIIGFLNGDINLDRKVDALDTLLITENFGKSVADVAARNVDLSRNGTIDLSDYLIVMQNEGKVGCAITWSNRFEIRDAVGGFSGRPTPMFTGAQQLRGLGWNFLIGPDDQLNETYIRSTARSIPAGELVFINVERWSIDIRIRSVESVTTAMNKLIQISKWIREENPHIKHGHYSMGPLSDYTAAGELRSLERMIATGPSHPNYSWALSAVRNARVVYNRWQAANDFLLPLIQEMDVVFPSLYIASPSYDYFLGFAEEHIRESRRLGKPVMPFLWPRYHPAGSLDYQDIPASHMRQQYESCRMFNADGLVIWESQPGTLPWNPSAPWLTELMQFYATLG